LKNNITDCGKLQGDWCLKNRLAGVMGALSESLRDGVDTLDRISTILAQSRVNEVKQALLAFE